MKIKSFSLNWFHFKKSRYFIIRVLLVTVYALLINKHCFSQTKYISDNYWIENYGKKEGLPEDIIIDITQDKKGYIWVTTPYSLVRFDGYKFKVFTPRKQFPDLYIHFYPGLLQDAEGLLWMATNGTGFFCFDPDKETFRRFHTEDKNNTLSNNYVTAIVNDDKKNIWVGTYKGLNLVSKKGDSISIKQFSVGYSEELLKTISRIIDQNKPVVGFSKVGELESKSATIEVKETTRFFVSCQGEISDSLIDYGWIENDKGMKIWSLDYSKSSYAGGSYKNRLQLDVITLTPGRYKVSYSSDDSHAWNKWYGGPPTKPDWWGIQLFKLNSKITDSIDLSIKETMRNRATYGTRIKALLKGTGNILWALTEAGLEKLNIEAALHGKLSNEKMTLPSTFFPSYYLLELDKDRLIMEGGIYDPGTKKNSGGSLIYNHKKNTFKLNDEGFSTAATRNSKAFLRDRNHNYWMGTFSADGWGLMVSEEGREVPKFKKLDISPATAKVDGKPGFEQIWSIYEDRSGYVWVGSRQNGLYKIKTRKSPVNFNNITVPGDDKIKINFTDIEEDAIGNIWLNCLTSGIFNYNRKNKQITHLPRSYKETDITFLLKGRDSALIISENHQTRQYYPNLSASKTFPISIPDSLYVVALDSYGNYWAIRKKNPTESNTFYIHDGLKFQPVTFDSSILNNGFYRNFHIGRKGNIWFSPGFEGVHQYILNNQTKKLIYVKKYLPEGVDVNDIYEDQNGIVWLATYNDGLIRLDPGMNTLKYFGRAEGLPSNQVIKIVPAGKKTWIMTDLGSAFLDSENETITINKELDEYILEHTNRSFFRSYGDAGFHDLALATQSNEIIIAATNGICIFNPEDIRTDTTKPILQIAGLSVDGKSFDLGKSTRNSGFKLKYHQNNLEIEYIGLHYDQPAKNQYTYFLKGANKDWVLAGQDRIARYSNLSPGYYEFYLKSANADGVWSEPEKMFSFTILPPWWKTWWAYSLYALAIAAAIWAFSVYRSRRFKKENILLEAKVEHRTAQLNNSLENLKSTQTQLIQSEKMASLGELTAGIAHEIQNPLNFVNNFSEVSTELVDEMNMEIDKGNTADAKLIAQDLKQNLEKINHHGKRAGDIVKGMLQHSRSSSGVKEPTDINKLVDEYLRLAYHGLRAKDKSFNATMKTDFDETIGNINIIPQDIGRAILNLITNAFYAVAEKAKQQTDGYDPTVTISTTKTNNTIEIKVQDNGNGIPKKVVDKVFQPFFTTKPTGQGTGLGLSLSYDIVKAHGGELKVETREEEGSEFKIALPYSA